MSCGCDPSNGGDWCSYGGSYDIEKDDNRKDNGGDGFLWFLAIIVGLIVYSCSGN